MSVGSARTATMVLILVGLGLVGFYAVSGSYIYGCFCAGSNVKTITLSSATLYAGTTASGSKDATSNITFSLNNPGSSTTITSITLGEERGGLAKPITVWSTTNQLTGAVNFNQAYSINGSNAVEGRYATRYTFYPVSDPSSSSQAVISPNDTYDCVISFANGQSVLGILSVR